MEHRGITQTVTGKAFEYTCLIALQKWAIANDAAVSIVQNGAFDTAMTCFTTVGEEMGIEHQQDMIAAAETAVRLIVPLEPMLKGPDTLQLMIAPDATARGASGDVRDVICVRHISETESTWSIGISCKHNHEGLRHPRITESMDFGTEWIGVRCSAEFMGKMEPVIASLVETGKEGVRWSQIPDKHIRYYMPILAAYLTEIQCMCADDETVPQRLLKYFFGQEDFYKVIMKSSARTTTIEGFNMNGSLGVPYGMVKPITKVPVLKMPTRLLDARFKEGSRTTIILTFDGGWAISMRLHNKDRIARPTSLAWEVYLEGLPPTTYINTHSWNE